MTATPEGDAACGRTVRFTSLNTGGMNSALKRTKVMTYIKNLNIDVVLLQETHLQKTDHRKLSRPWIGHIFHSQFSNKTRGTAILIKKNAQFVSTNVLSDTEGRYIIVAGMLYQKPVVLVSIYAPNWDDPNFFTNVLSVIPNVNSHALILGGDMNCVIDPVLDRSSPRTIPPSKMSQTLSTFMDQLGFIDPWRFTYPSSRQYSFFSHAYRSFSRIDFFLIDKTLISSITSVQYLPIIVSDHSTIVLDLRFNLKPKQFRFWRLDTLLLADEEFCKYVSDSITFFYDINRNDETSPSLLWDTMKAFLRGKIISYTNHVNKSRKARREELTKSIADIDRSLSVTNTPDLFKERLRLKTELDLLLTTEAEHLILRSRGSLYEHGDKAGRILANQLRAKQVSNQIIQIKDKIGTVVSDPVKINASFKSFYSHLYESESPSDETQMNTFFQKFDLPRVPANDNHILDAPLTILEIKEAITTMNSGKSPGPDGYPVEFFKKFSTQLAPLLLEMFNYSYRNGSLPTSLTQASISLIYKKGKDPLSCASYRPISLLPVDVKILAKVLARRLEPILPLVISEDQTGFIKGRHSFTNVRRLLGVIHTSSPSTDPEVVISLDAEKAFDRVEWPYLFSSLKHFGFGNGFISWVKLLYSLPQASVCTNTQRSDLFPLFRGTRQGCPLSPLLFALAIEPLSIALKSEKAFKGIRRHSTEHKVSLYADDLLLYVNDPLSSLPPILSLLDSFSVFSGYKLNISKSEYLPINQQAIDIPSSLIPFRVAETGMKYLGTIITKSLHSTKDQNFTALTSTVKQDLQKWNRLSLSLAGRVQTIKMNVLPRYLYLFQCLPICLPRVFFNVIDSIISTFIWAGKRARANRTLLQRKRSLGGLGLPNLLGYYWAANTQKIMYWFTSPQHNWCQMEADSCSISLQALVCSTLPLPISNFTSNPIVLNTLKIWIQIWRRHGWCALPQSTPLCNNHLFVPAKIDPRFTALGKKGLRTLGDLYIDGIFASFNQLCSTYNLCNTDFFRFFQLRDFARSHSSQFPHAPPLSGIDLVLQFKSLPKGHISHFYNLLTPTNSSVVDKSRADWETELQINISNSFWERALSAIHSSSSCARLSVIQFKVLFRLHYSRDKLFKLFPDRVSEACDRCSQIPCNLSHMFWSCSKLSSFWQSFFKSISDILGLTINPSPQIAIFGVSPDELVTTSMQNRVMAFASLIARRKILLQWKSPQPPSFKSWLYDLLHLLKLEKIKFQLRGCSQKFYSHWGPLLNYVKNLPAAEVAP